MILGHYASALVAKTELPKFPLWILLICANLADFIWIALGFAGVEAPLPKSVLDATFNNIMVTMTYSHDLLPTILLAIAIYFLVRIFAKSPKAAVWCAGLVILHFECDLVAGYEHHIAGTDSPSIGLNTYQRAPHTALIIEAVFAIVCIYLFTNRMRQQGQAIPRKTQILLYGFFLIGILAWWPTATIPLKFLIPNF